MGDKIEYFDQFILLLVITVTSPENRLLLTQLLKMTKTHIWAPVSYLSKIPSQKRDDFLVLSLCGPHLWFPLVPQWAFASHPLLLKSLGKCPGTSALQLPSPQWLWLKLRKQEMKWLWFFTLLPLSSFGPTSHLQFFLSSVIWILPIFKTIKAGFPEASFPVLNVE